MYRKIAVNVFGAATIILAITAIIGMAVSGSHQWVQPVEEASWMMLVITVLSAYLLAGPGPGKPQVVSKAWRNSALAAGAVAIVLFIVALVTYATSAEPSTWIESIELAGMLAMVVTVLSCVMATGGFGRRAKD